MAGVWRKAAEYLGVMEPQDNDYDDEMDDFVEPVPVRPLSAEAVRARRSSSGVDRYEQVGSLAVDVDRTRSFDEAVAAVKVPTYRITTFVPASYNDAKQVGEHFRQNVPVIINLTELDDRSAMRLIDFCAGLTFGLHGTLERVTNKVFLLSPADVEVTAEDKARIREGGFFNQS
jgi:cell division inhibitor SepF